MATLKKHWPSFLSPCHSCACSQLRVLAGLKPSDSMLSWHLPLSSPYQACEWLLPRVLCLLLGSRSVNGCDSSLDARAATLSRPIPRGETAALNAQPGLHSANLQLPAAAGAGARRGRHKLPSLFSPVRETPGPQNLGHRQAKLLFETTQLLDDRGHQGLLSYLITSTLLKWRQRKHLPSVLPFTKWLEGCSCFLFFLYITTTGKKKI